MLPKETQSDFGRYLRAYRMDKGLSLDEVAQQTKITLSCLQQIENEDLLHLPQDVFVRGLLKAYADAVGGDAKEALLRYQKCCSMQKQFERDAYIKSLGENFWWRFILALLLLAGTVGATLYGVQMVNPADSALTQSDMTENEVFHQPPKLENPSLGRHATLSESQPASPTLELRATAVAYTRLKIIADGKLPRDYELQQGEQVTVTAKAHLNLLIVNAGGIRLTLNGKQVTVPGRANQIVTLDLPQI
jgi:cytoskeletal protein RodZ